MGNKSERIQSFLLKHGHDVALGVTGLSGISSVDSLVTNSSTPLVATGALLAAAGTVKLATIRAEMKDFIDVLEGFGKASKKEAEKSDHLEASRAAGLIAPEGTNEFLMDFNGTYYEHPGGEVIEVGMEDCGTNGVCTEIFRTHREPNGDKTVMHAHVREDNTMEFGFAYKEIGGDIHNKEDLDFATELEKAQQRLVEIRQNQ